MSITDRQAMYFKTIQALVDDAAAHWEVLMIWIYMRDPIDTSPMNPMGRLSYSMMATNHTDYDRLMLPATVKLEMDTMRVTDHFDTRKKL